MKANPDNRSLAISQKIYGWLLRAYPPAHRVEYGTAMAQLFRDQCRDAWTEARAWGLLKLWLRVLPDLVKTSIIERLTALTTKKSMSDKITTLVQPRAVFLKVFVTVFLIIVTVSVIITNLLPETYASTARVKIEKDQPDAGYDPYFVQTQFEIMQSQLVLQPVIDRLNLNVKWGKKYYTGETFKSAETENILRDRLVLQPVRNTKLISITVYGDDKVEAAQIANAISESYRDYRVGVQRGIESKSLDVLHQQYSSEEDQIKQAQAGVSAASMAGNEAEMARQIEAHKRLNIKIMAAEMDVKIPSSSAVQIVDSAEPGHAPVRPNKTVNVLLGIVCGIVLASIIGGLAVFITLHFGKRNDRNATAK